MKRILLSVILMACLGCGKHAAQAPVPGTINTFDAYAARSVGDAQEAIMSSKTWEICSDNGFPASVDLDGETRLCDPVAGMFPAKGRPLLFKAEQTFNIALSAAQAYHAGATMDTTGLTQAITQLGLDIANLLTGIGKGKQ